MVLSLGFGFRFWVSDLLRLGLGFWAYTRH